MRKVLILTAAVLAAVFFFLLLTLPSAPRAAVWTGDASLARRTVAGAYHVHTTRSDGAGDRAAVAAAAARAGLQFVILTDHGDATRVPDAPAYLDGVLCIDGVELSTNGGHYVALGIGAAPYPLGGEPAGVVEDVARLGGFGIVAHPDSGRPELAWTDWDPAFDGIEWLNADSEWRNESTRRLARVLFDYLLRPAPALASMLDRPSATLARWDALTARRPVVALAGHDAHGGIGRTLESGRRSGLGGIPSYDASFRSFTTRVILDAPPAGDAATDAARLLDAIRRGRVFTAIDAIAAPAVLDFHATPGGHGLESVMGSALPPGPATLIVNASVPAGGRIVLLRNGREVSSSAGSSLRMEDHRAEGAYRVEVQVAGAGGTPPVPWLLSNPIYFLAPAPAPPAATASDATPLPRDVSWHVEKDRASSGSIVHSPEEIAFYYRLRAGARASQFAALVAEIQGKAGAFDRIRFTGQAGRPVRISVQLRYPQGGGLRWGRSVYLDVVPRDITIPIAEMRPADRQTARAPALSAATSLLFVADLTNARPGDANTIRIARVDFAR